MTDRLTWEDHQAIEDLLATYCECVDRYDLAGVAATFTSDAVTDYGPGRGGEVAGRDAIRDRIGRGQSEFRRTHHQLGQTLLAPAPGDGVDGVTYVTATHERWDGRRETLCLRYLDRLVEDRGRWHIAARRVEAAVVEGFVGVAWEWVDRAAP